MSENMDSGVNKSVINWYPGHMVKAKREIKEKIDLIDIVYEVIDARMPISSRIPLDDLIENKKINDLRKFLENINSADFPSILENLDDEKTIMVYYDVGVETIINLILFL